MRIRDHYLHAPLPWRDEPARVGCTWTDEAGTHRAEVEVRDGGLRYEDLTHVPLCVIEELWNFAVKQGLTIDNVKEVNA